jgi:hypothetical protein
MNKNTVRPSWLETEMNMLASQVKVFTDNLTGESATRRAVKWFSAFPLP